MKKYYLLIGVIIITFFGCKKEIDLPIENTNSGTIEIIHGGNQTGYFGERLADSIAIRALADNADRFLEAKFTVIEGNGVVTPYKPYLQRGDSRVHLDSTGLLYLNWRLGCDLPVQKLQVELFLDSTSTSSSGLHQIPAETIIITANASQKTGWTMSCGYIPGLNRKIISYDGITLYLIGGGIYESTDDGLNWAAVEGLLEWENIVDAEFNNLGWLYVTTSTNGIFYTKDFNTWEYINNGILDMRDPVSLLIEDSVMFVSFRFGGVYRSNNNGQLWQKLTIDPDQVPFKHLTSHPNGNIYLIDKSDAIWESKDDGDHWEWVLREGPRVSAFEISDDGLIYIGNDEASIIEVSLPDYERKEYRHFMENIGTQFISHIEATDQDVFYSIFRGQDDGIFSKNNNWSHLDMEFNKIVSSFYRKSDNNFILLSPEGVYVSD